jgi:hypothetical protein
MLKKFYLVVLGCCLSWAAMASTLELASDDDMFYEKDGWYLPKQGAVEKYAPAQKNYSVRATAPVRAPAKVVVPLKVTPAKPVPFPARIAPAVENNYPWIVSGSMGYSWFSQAGDNSTWKDSLQFWKNAGRT